MAKKKGNVYGAVVLYEKTYKGTSIGRRPNTSSMNKNRRRQLGKKPYYRGQGKWNDLIFIRMESLYLTKCHKILDHHKAEVHVAIVVCFLKDICFVEYGELEVWKILMFATNGDQDILEDNGTYFT